MVFLFPVAYYTYIYAKVDRKHYKKVTSYTYSAIFAGRFLGGVVAQLLVSFDIMDFHQLNYISLTCVSVAVIFSFFLPSVQQSIYFHRAEELKTLDPRSGSGTVSETDLPNKGSPSIPKKIEFSKKIKLTRIYLLSDFKDAYSSSYVLKWSLWWAVGKH